MKHSSRERKGVQKKQKASTSRNAEEEELITLREAIDYLASDEVQHPNNVQVNLSLTYIENVSHSRGLQPEDLITLVDIIGSQVVNKSVCKKLLYCLIPSQSVPEDAVINAVSYICSQKLDMNLQKDFFKWINSIYDDIDTTERLSCLYTVIFVLLESDQLRPFVCQLLYKMTKYEHVKAFRVTHLLDLQSRIGAQACLLYLLQLYKNYRPDLVLVDCKYKRAFPSLGRFQKFLTEVKQKTAPESRKSVAAKVAPEEPASLYVRKDVTQFFHLEEVYLSLNNERGIVNLLHSPLRRVLLTSGIPEDLLIRLRLFIRSSLYSNASWSTSFVSKDPRAELLSLLSTLSFEIQESIPDVLTFIGSYLNIWDGLTNLDSILDLIQYWEICLFHDLSEAVLQTLFKYFCCSSVDFKCSVIHTLTKLYQHWIAFELPRHKNNREETSAEPSSHIKPLTIFSQEKGVPDVEKQIEMLASYIDSLCVRALNLHRNHPPILLYNILAFYKMVLDMRELSRATTLLVPSSPVVCASIFTNNPAILSLICVLISRYVEEVKYIKMQATVKHKRSKIVSLLNSYISDMCNMLWRCIAFRPEENSIFFQSTLPSHLLKSVYKAEDSFDISRHPALVGLAFNYLSNAQEEMSASVLVTDSDIREQYLHLVSQSGFPEITNFVRSFIRIRRKQQETSLSRDV